MTTRERMVELTTPDEVDNFLKENSTCAFFKAGGCHKTMQGFSIVEEILNSRKQVPLGLVRVIESRPASNHIAELMNITHESPQFILLIEGKPVYDVDNWNITAVDLNQALNTFFGEAIDSESQETLIDLDQVAPYIDLLQRFVNEELPEAEFTQQWLSTFQSDSSLRSSKELDLLGSLFGDVDEAIHCLHKRGVSSDLKEKSKTLLTKLKI